MVTGTVKGGDKLKEFLNRVTSQLQSAQSVKIGFMGDATYPDGTSVALIAAVNEYGRAPIQPPRPFFRRMIAEKSPTWGASMASLMVMHKYDSRLVLGGMGEEIAAQLRQSIVDLVSPPLNPTTIARKGFDKPLIDTTVMMNAITYEISQDKVEP